MRSCYMLMVWLVLVSTCTTCLMCSTHTLRYFPDEEQGALAITRRLEIQQGKGQQPLCIKSVDDAVETISSGKVTEARDVEALALLSVGVELSYLKPPQGVAPLGTSWLTSFMDGSVEKLKAVRSHDDEFARMLDKFSDRMKGHTYTMNIPVAMQRNMIRTVDHIAEEYTGESV